MDLVFIDEFGCTKKWEKLKERNRNFQPTRGYGGIIIPAENFVEFADGFAVLKILALRQFNTIAPQTMASINKLNKIDPNIMNPKVSPQYIKNIIKFHHDRDKIRSSIVRAELKSSDMLRRDKKLIHSRKRFLRIFLRCIIENNASGFYCGFEKKTINLPKDLYSDREISLKEIDYVVEVLRKNSIKKSVVKKLLFDQHSIDEQKNEPLARKRKFDKIIQDNNLSRWFPDTATIDVNSRYSLGMQAADWVCGLVSRYLSFNVEPKHRDYDNMFFPKDILSSWSQVIIPESSLRHGRGIKFSKSLIKDVSQMELPF